MVNVVTRGAHSFRYAKAFFVSALLVTPFAQAAAPTITGSPLTTTFAGKAYSFQPTAKDADGNKLTFSIAAKPLWANFSTSTGRLSGTPREEDARAWSNIVISVTDGKSTAALAAFSIDPEGSGMWVGYADAAADRPEAVTTLAIALRAHASQVGNAKVEAMLPDLTWLRDAFRAAGYEQGEWKVELWIFERRFDQDAADSQRVAG